MVRSIAVMQYKNITSKYDGKIGKNKFKRTNFIRLTIRRWSPTYILRIIECQLKSYSKHYLYHWIN